MIASRYWGSSNKNRLNIPLKTLIKEYNNSSGIDEAIIDISFD